MKSNVTILLQCIKICLTTRYRVDPYYSFWQTCTMLHFISIVVFLKGFNLTCKYWWWYKNKPCKHLNHRKNVVYGTNLSCSKLISRICKPKSILTLSDWTRWCEMGEPYSNGKGNSNQHTKLHHLLNYYFRPSKALQKTFLISDQHKLHCKLTQLVVANKQVELQVFKHPKLYFLHLCLYY